MDRRRFIATSLLGGIGVASAAPARAFQMAECKDDTAALACRTLAEHDELLQQIDRMLAEKGLDEAQRRTVLASASCPFCGQLLAPAPGRF
ncbi:MAG: hypothetical protein ACM31L_19910 [Actinomycetota bacterium]